MIPRVVLPLLLLAACAAACSPKPRQQQAANTSAGVAYDPGKPGWVPSNGNPGVGTFGAPPASQSTAPNAAEEVNGGAGGTHRSAPAPPVWPKPVKKP